MIQLYRISGFFLLIASGASLASLLARLVEGLREPLFYVSLILSTALGIAGTVIYYSKQNDNQDWILYLSCVAGIAVSLLIGGLIQWR